MSATIIILPTGHYHAWDGSRREQEIREELCGLSFLLDGRPPRGKPRLVYQRTRVVSDDDFFNGGGNAA